MPGRNSQRQLAMKQLYAGNAIHSKKQRFGPARSKSAGALVSRQGAMHGMQGPCGCAKTSMQMARKSSEILVHQLLCWRCSFCSGAVEGFEDEPITVMPVGHDGSAVSEELAQHLSRWLAKLMTEDRQRLGQLRAQQRQQRNQEAFEKWKRHKEMEARKRQPQDEEVLSRQMDRRNRPSREQCDSHYEAWCRRYDARYPRPQSAPGTRPRVAEVARDQYVPVTFGAYGTS